MNSTQTTACLDSPQHPREAVEVLRRMMTLLKLVAGPGRLDDDRAKRLLREAYGYRSMTLDDWHRDVDALCELGLIEVDQATFELVRLPNTNFWPFAD